MTRKLNYPFLMFVFCLLFIEADVFAQITKRGLEEGDRTEIIAFGDMDQWVTRRIKESGIIGGNTTDVYAIGPTETIEGAEPYENKGGSPWATSNVLARVAGITKTNTSVFPERRNTGFAARMDTRMESVRVLGIIDITVLAAGSVFLGTVHEPIRSTKDPNSILSMGIPFDKKPTALCFDHKLQLSGENNSIKATGFGKITTARGKDLPVAKVFLQKRWEDDKGNIQAHRIGTMVVQFYENEDWTSDNVYEIEYGDITDSEFYLEDRMALTQDEYFFMNSKGKNVPVNEVGWGSKEDEPTHLIIQFSSSNGGAYIGSPGNKMWVDNVRLVY